MKKNVIVVGCSGYMGQVVCRLIQESTDMKVHVGYDSKQCKNLEFPFVSSIEDLKKYKNADIIIDFSSPDCTIQMLEYASLHKIPIIIATTGFTEDQEEIIKNYSSKIPIFMSANMSYEITLIKKTLEQLAPKLSNCDIEITETHHNRKKDAPSGTAKLLANSINSSLNNSKKIIYGRQGKRNANEIGISSLRGGNIVGTHTVSFFGEYETIEITHTALSRDLFAEGALKAARFILNQSSGMYNMDSLI